LSKFKKALKKKELTQALAKHPLKELDSEIKNDYIKGLVFVAIEDENFSEEEKSYITALMQNIGVDEALLSEFEAFAQDPDEDALMEFMDRLKAFDEDLKINFLIEVIVISFKDGEFDESEQEMFNDYVDMLELEDKKEIITYIALALANKDTDLALSIYTADKEFFNKYNYMFEMIGIDVEKELQKVFSWEWVKLKVKNGRFIIDYNTLVNEHFVADSPVSIQQYCIFLNSTIINGYFKDIFDIKKIEKLNLNFENGLFDYAKDNKTDAIFGIDANNISLFIEYVNINKNLQTIREFVIKYKDEGLMVSNSIVFMGSSKNIFYENKEIIYHEHFTQANSKYVYINGDYFSRDFELDENKNYTFRVMKG